MTKDILICTDLDRTLIPNGAAKESPQARLRFSNFSARSEITLVYVSGRHHALVIEAINRYKLPRPQYVITDVGSCIYTFSEDALHEAPVPWTTWTQNISADWTGQTLHDIKKRFTDLSVLRLQETTKQNDFKLSYYAPLEIDHVALLRIMQMRLSGRKIRARLIWSVDAAEETGLLDILPARAGKYHAIDFMMRRLGFSIKNTIFAGDSGNDLEVLSSAIPAVLVANSSREVQNQARQRAKREGHSETLYLAKGGFMGMNGNYSGGILEGIAHYLPQCQAWMTRGNEA